MNFSALSSFPGTMLWFYGIGGAFFIIFGFIMHRKISRKKAWNNADLEKKAVNSVVWRGEIEYWHISEVALPDIASSMSRIVPSIAIGVGIGSLFFTVAYAFLLMSPVWKLICPFSIGSFTDNIWFLILIIGGSGGGADAFRRLRREACAMRNDGPTRRLGDYRSALFFLIPGVWFVLFCGLLFAFHVSYQPLNTNCLGNDFSPKPWQMGLVYPWLGFALLAFLSTEVLLALIASAHSPLIPTNIPEAVAVDDMFRAKIIGITQYINISQIMLFGVSLPLVVSFPYSLVAEFLPIIFLLAALMLLSSSGALGGKLTGWFWERKQRKTLE